MAGRRSVVLLEPADGGRRPKRAERSAERLRARPRRPSSAPPRRIWVPRPFSPPTASRWGLRKAGTTLAPPGSFRLTPVPKPADLPPLPHDQRESALRRRGRRCQRVVESLADATAAASSLHAFRELSRVELCMLLRSGHSSEELRRAWVRFVTERFESDRLRLAHQATTDGPTNALVPWAAGIVARGHAGAVLRSFTLLQADLQSWFELLLRTDYLDQEAEARRRTTQLERSDRLDVLRALQETIPAAVTPPPGSPHSLCSPLSSPAARLAADRAAEWYLRRKGATTPASVAATAWGRLCGTFEAAADGQSPPPGDRQRSSFDAAAAVAAADSVAVAVD